MASKAWMIGWVALCLAWPAAAQMSGNTPLFSVTLDEAEASVAAALIAEGVADDVKVEIVSTRQPLLYQYKQPLEVRVKSLKTEEAGRTWSGNLLFVAKGEVVSAMPVSGRYDEVERLPVLSQRIAHGETITAEHVVMKPFPRSRIRPGMVTDEKELIGKTPRRTISVNRPIRADEVQAPDVLQKGSMVKMLYQTPYMEISTLGEALEGGAVGQSVRVRNRDSGMTIYGTVLSADEVQVSAQPARDRRVASRR
jgi:flagella basal body P-ring formation protein FlgA